MQPNPHAIERAELVVNELMGDYDDAVRQSIAHHLASYLLPGYVPVKAGGWSVVSPDGRCFTGNSAHHAANEANRAMRTPEQEAEMAASLAALQSQHDADMLADHEHLNCPACGGSGHVDDAIGIAAGVALTAAACDVLAEDTVQRLMGLAMDFAHKYSFVGDDSMFRAMGTLESALREALSAFPVELEQPEQPLGVSPQAGPGSVVASLPSIPDAACGDPRRHLTAEDCARLLPKSKAEAIAFLKSAGILTPDGGLSPNYYSPEQIAAHNLKIGGDALTGPGDPVASLPTPPIAAGDVRSAQARLEEEDGE